MKKIILVLITATFISCNPEPAEKIGGVYVRESVWQPRNINTGKVLGNATIRDTIFIIKMDEGYQVKNAKWRKNDYDINGWREVSFSEGKIRPHQTKYDKKTQALISLEPLLANDIYLDLKTGILFINIKKELTWKKIKP